MDPGLVTAKQPHFSIIDDKALEEVRAWEPKAIFANAVLQHVPPVELPTFFQRLGRILAPGAVAAIVFIADASITQVKAMSWAYPDEVLTSAMLEADRKLRARFFLIDGDDANAFHAGRRLLKIDRLA
jgi:trans-aconitate methyltransferase